MHAISPQNTNVLVVENNGLVAHALGVVLKDAGYRVTVAGNGLQALASVAKDAPDVVMTDLHMPRLEGAALIRQLRSTNPHLPIVVLTANPPYGGLKELAAGGPGRMALLFKPASAEQVIDSLQSVLAH
ncbi:response regulator [Azospirillum brasilense]|uniref:Response regulatory domain-containing protein n=1 Tax=Azospirillum brasilense TaxID=192 RepID=A0A235H3J9_AZOBR|nr:response regulator [Azospirillum brasilense]OYD80408.1 hypothetical protein CHT98_31365 [Azospirillum brasilense]